MYSFTLQTVKIKLFTKRSHHRNATIILILQNLFARGTVVRTASLISHYTALFKKSARRWENPYICTPNICQNPQVYRRCL